MTITNLTSKFDALQQQLTTQQTAFMARLQYTNDLLGQILVALGQPVQAETTTLTDVATILMAIHADTTSVDTRLLTLADIHLDTMSMDEKLLLIRNAISTPGEALPYTRFAGSYSSIAWNIQRISLAMGTVFEAGNPTNQVNLLDVLEYFKYYLPKVLGKPIDNSGNGDSYRSMLYLLQGIFNGIGSDVDSAQLGVLLQTIINQLGAPLAGETIAQLIKDVDNHTAALLIAQPPPTGGTNLNSCTLDYSSEGITFVPTGILSGLGFNVPSLIYVTWPTPPVPLAYAAGISGISSNSGLAPISGTWHDWHIYVETDAPYYGRNVADLTRYEPNVWLPVAEDNSTLYAFVSEEYSLRAYLCPPGELFGQGGGGGGGFDTQFTIQSIMGEAWRDNYAHGTTPRIVLPGADLRTNAPGGWQSIEPIYHWNNPFQGWVIKATTKPFRIYFFNTGAGQVVTVGSSYTLNTSVQDVFWIDDYVDGQNVGAFEVLMIPPL